MEIYLSSKNTGQFKLTEYNHAYNRINSVRDYFGFKELRRSIEDLKYQYSIQHSIESWFDEDTPRDVSLNPLDIIWVIRNSQDESFWIPWKEYQMINSFKKIFPDNPTFNLDFGYIDGRMHHLGPFASNGFASASMNRGYEIFIECSPLGWIPDTTPEIQEQTT